MQSKIQNLKSKMVLPIHILQSALWRLIIGLTAKAPSETLCAPNRD